MIREVIATGRDVNTAIDNGCAELGIDRDNAQFEIISLPKKGFLGLKIYPAKVKVFEELPDLPKPPAPKPAVVQPPKSAPAPTQRAKQTTAAPAPTQQAKPPVPQPRPAVQQPRPTPAHAPCTEDKREDFGEPIPQTEIIPTPELRAKVERAAVYLAEIMRAMGFDTIEVTPAYYSENICLRLSGAQLGVVIGRRGETLDALQYLTSLVANRGEGEYIRVNIDSGNYREKREKTLTALAKKLALQAVRTGKSTTLEPMNPYERRVIHGAVSQIRGAVSTSIGADPNRRVVISVSDHSKRTGDIQPEYGHGGERGARGRGGDRSEHSGRDNRAGKVASGPRPPLRPNTNTAESVAAAKSAPTVARTDDGTQGHTATFVARKEAPVHTDTIVRSEPVQAPRMTLSAVEAPVAPVAPVATVTPVAPVAPVVATPAKRLSDAERFGDIPMGVPIISGDCTAPRVQEKKIEAKPEPKKIEGTLYGKIE